jgi:hypothetical protein
MNQSMDLAVTKVKELSDGSDYQSYPELTDAVAEWQLMRTPIEIIATDEELRVLEAQA